MDLVADESVDGGIIKNLQLVGFNILSIAESSPGISDIQVLNIAFEKGWLLITEDKDFCELVHRLKMNHSGILLIRMNDIPRVERLITITSTIAELHGKLQKSFSVLSSNGLKVKIS
jgi:predicted nuclease of predicted toxin-antitoxin system